MAFCPLRFPSIIVVGVPPRFSPLNLDQVTEDVKSNARSSFDDCTVADQIQLSPPCPGEQATSRDAVVSQVKEMERMRRAVDPEGFLLTCTGATNTDLSLHSITANHKLASSCNRLDSPTNVDQLGVGSLWVRNGTSDSSSGTKFHARTIASVLVSLSRGPELSRALRNAGLLRPGAK